MLIEKKKLIRFIFFFSSRRRHTRLTCDWSSDVCSSDLLLHRKHSAEIVTHLQPAGPFAGWSQIDEERTDCLVIARKIAPAGELEPARIYAHVTFWRAADKARKRPMFS